MSDLDMVDLPTTPGKGGRRPGAGRKPRIKIAPTIVDIVERDPDGVPVTTIPDTSFDPAASFAVARARKEVADANLKELDFQVKSAKYLPRDDVRQAIATAFSTVAQTLRSIPDNLERRLGLSTEISEQVSVLIDECMGDLALDLERIYRDNERTPASEAESRQAAKESTLI